MSKFWTDERIGRTVTAGYVIQTLGSRGGRKLNQPLQNGEGLTELTYLDYIILRCPRLFLLLSEIGCHENVFQAIDNNLDDGELPIPEVPGAMDPLGLRTPAQVKKFQRLQHAYHIQDLEEGAQMHFEETDVVPVTAMVRAKVNLPTSFEPVTVKGIQLWRRKFQLRPDSGFKEVDFDRRYVLYMQRVKHPHLTTIWATYTHAGYGYLLMQPYVGLTLESFMNDTPKSFKQLPFPRQRLLLTHWVQCLTAALGQLHDYGIPHKAIRPSNIYVDDQFHIWLGPYQALGAGAEEQAEDAFKKDFYNHAPPEQYQTRHKVARGEGPGVSMQGGGRTRRRVETPSSGNFLNLRRPVTASGPSTSGESSNSGSSQDPMSPISAMSSHSRFLERPSTGSSGETVRVSVNVINYAPVQPQKGWSRTVDAQFFPSDVFSLSTVFVKLVTFIASLASPNSSTSAAKIPEYLGKNRSNAGRGGAVPDRSFHANLGQVDSWLDKVEKAIGRSPEKPSRKISLGRKHNVNKHDDPDKDRWQGTFTELITLLRHGLLKEPDRRWSTVEGAAAIDSILQKWDLPTSPCCGDVARDTFDYTSSSARSPSPGLRSSIDGTNRTSSMGYTVDSSIETSSRKFELAAAQYNPPYVPDLSDYDVRNSYRNHYERGPARPARGPPEAMYDDSVSFYSERQESFVGEYATMRDRPLPPPGRGYLHPAFREPHFRYEPVHELPDTQLPRIHAQRGRLVPPQQPYPQCTPPPLHDLPPIPTSQQISRSRYEQSARSSRRMREEEDEVEEMAEDLQDFYIRRNQAANRLRG